MLTKLWPVRHRRNRSSKMQPPTTTTNVVGKCRIEYKQRHYSHYQHNVSHKCFIWIVAWLSLFAILTQAQINLYSAPSQKKQQPSNTSTQSTSAPFSNSPLQLTTLQRIPLGAISNSGKGRKVYKCDTKDRKREHSFKDLTVSGKELTVSV